jgi:hypothetical protein
VIVIKRVLDATNFANVKIVRIRRTMKSRKKEHPLVAIVRSLDVLKIIVSVSAMVIFLLKEINAKILANA